MADFEGNPFADPDGINPFAVSGNFVNQQYSNKCGMARGLCGTVRTDWRSTLHMDNI